MGIVRQALAMTLLALLLWPEGAFAPGTDVGCACSSSCCHARSSSAQPHDGRACHGAAAGAGALRCGHPTREEAQASATPAVLAPASFVAPIVRSADARMFSEQRLAPGFARLDPRPPRTVSFAL